MSDFKEPPIDEIKPTETLFEQKNISCDPCRKYKRACNRQSPCAECLKKQFKCVYSAKRPRSLSTEHRDKDDEAYIRKLAAEHPEIFEAAPSDVQRIT